MCTHFSESTSTLRYLADRVSKCTRGTTGVSWCLCNSDVRRTGPTKHFMRTFDRVRFHWYIGQPGTSLQIYLILLAKNLIAKEKKNISTVQLLLIILRVPGICNWFYGFACTKSGEDNNRNGNHRNENMQIFRHIKNAHIGQKSTSEEKKVTKIF